MVDVIFLVLGAFLSPLDFFMANMALPEIKKDFYATDSELQLVIAAYGVTYASCVITAGKLGDLFGRKQIFMSGMFLFVLASVGCALSPTVNFLIGFRIVQGLGAALIGPQVLASIRIIFKEHERGIALGIFGTVFGLSAIAGQLIGGYILRTGWFNLTWQNVFWINVPIGLLSCVGSYFLLPENKASQKERIDYGGMVFISLALALFIVGIVEAKNQNWSGLIMAMILLSMGLFILFFWFEQQRIKRQKSVMIYLPILMNRLFLRNLLCIFLYNFIAGFFLIYPYYLQEGLGWNSMQTGYAILPYGLGFFISPLLVPRFSIKDHRIAWIGQWMLAIGFLSTSLYFLKADGGQWWLGGSLFVAGFGHGILLPVLMKISMARMDEKMVGQASGIISTAIQLGSVLGGVLLGTLFFNLLPAFTFEKSIGLTLLFLAIIQFFVVRLHRLNFKNK